MTSEQIAALAKFRNVYGRTWKSALSRCWMQADYPTGFNGPALQRLRNERGPSWLFSKAERELDTALATHQIDCR